MSRTILAGLLVFALGCGSKPQTEPTKPEQPTPPPSLAPTVTEPPAAKPLRQPGEPLRPDDAPYIAGSVTVRGAPPGAVLRVGYFGTFGPDVFGFGGTEAELVPSRTAKSETDKPRVSMLVAGDGNVAPSKFDHTKLAPGRYMVYAELKNGPIAWKWVALAAGGTATVDLTLDATQTGALEVGVPIEVVGRVQLAPADEPNQPLLSPALFTAIAWRFDLQADVIARKAVFKGLGPGRYEVRSGGRFQVVEIVPGKIVECDLERRPEAPTMLCTPAEHTLSRRRFLGASALGLAGLATPAVAEKLRKERRQVLFVWLDGGMSQLESWDPKPNTPFGGPLRAIPTSVTGVHISETLPHSARVMKHLAVVRSVCTQDDSHSAGVDRIQRGDPKNRGVVYPFFGSAVAKLVGDNGSALPPYVWVKPMSGGFIYKDAGFLGPKYGALALGDGKPPDNLLRPKEVTTEDDDERNELRKLVDAKYAEQRRRENTEANTHAFEMAAQLQKKIELFDLSKLPQKDEDRYGTHDLGRHLLLARRLLEEGVTFVKVTSYGWDSHGDHFNQALSQHPKFDRPFAAIIEDLRDRGMLDNVLVVACAEFGRTPRINGHVGRDHWPQAWSVCMAGRGIKPGVVAGRTNDKGTEVATEPVDIGGLFHTWYRALGIDPTETQFRNGGQPLPIAHEDMKPVTEVLA